MNPKLQMWKKFIQKDPTIPYAFGWAFTYLVLVIFGVREAAACYGSRVPIGCEIPIVFGAVLGIVLSIVWPLVWLVGLLILIAKGCA